MVLRREALERRLGVQAHSTVGARIWHQQAD